MLTFDGCSTKNAFSNFKITDAQEKSEDNIQSSKIKDGKIVDGLVTAIYLNKVLPQTYKENDYFYVYLYTKHNNDNIKFLLNGNRALRVEELKAENMFTYLTSFKAEWSRYYLVAFKTEDNKLSFSVKNAQFSSNKLIFEKEGQ
jgi:asparagine N-glycosylation enzyme membrane subunit Stt3